MADVSIKMKTRNQARLSLRGMVDDAHQNDKVLEMEYVNGTRIKVRRAPWFPDVVQVIVQKRDETKVRCFCPAVERDGSLCWLGVSWCDEERCYV